MKKMIKCFVIAAVMLTPIFLQAQSPLDKIFAKYAGNDKFTTVNFSKEMFQMFASMADPKDTSNAAFQKAISKMTGLKVVSMDVDTLKPAAAMAFYNEAAAVFPPAVYKELMNVTDKGTNVRFLTKEDTKGIITELVMLEKGKKDALVMSITGIIDLATVSKISKSMNIQGMDELKKYKQPHKK